MSSWGARVQVPEDCDAARCMLPGVVGPDNSIDANVALWLGLLMARLQRVATDPGSGDRDFLKLIRGRDPATLKDRTREKIMHLAWKYRWQLPDMLRPGSDPYAQTEQEKAA